MKQPKQASTRVAFNTLILYARMGITMFISLYTTRLILNSLGASDFGIFNIVGGAIAMLGFLNAAMAGATQRFMSYTEGAGDKEKQKSIFNISVILHFGIAILVGIVLLIAGYFFFNGILNIPVDRMHAARMVYYFMIVSTMLTVMTVPYDAVLNAHENMLYYLKSAKNFLLEREKILMERSKKILRNLLAIYRDFLCNLDFLLEYSWRNCFYILCHQEM